ncbi:MAG TPA: NEW3 domain-containing protein [Jatrophihabitans sp.]|jgi:alpha-mannosidase
MQISEIVSTERFVRTPDGGEAQVLEVALVDPDGDETLTAFNNGEVVGTARCDAERVEVPLTGLAGRPPGSIEAVRVEAGTGLVETVRVTIAEPGWTVWMISHFHYDPVWWNTQAAYTATWDELPGPAQQFRQTFQQTGFALVDAHLEAARRDPDYKFVLAEVDYIKPYWDARPQQRAYLRRLLAEGRLEIMGGTYNEPNTNLTTTETTVRNFVHGRGFQHGVLGGDPQTAWQLDVFGHDPQFPGLAAEAGLTSSSWARGPHHQWGPMLSQPRPEGGWGDPAVMQFPAEFEWVSPSGKGVLTHYMPAHYSAGWQIDSKPSLAEAEAAVYELFVLLKRVAATRNVLLPVGTDWTPPSKWLTDIQRDWNARYSSPRFECGLPKQFFAAVRAELDQRGRAAAPQTRDMNPVYTGKDVSYIDTKQAQRSAESLLVDAEMFAAIATRYGAAYPHATLDKAWRQLVFGAHHDAITGSESDQVYLDLLTTWREAHGLGRQVLKAALDHLAASLPGAPADGLPVTVFNPSAWARGGPVDIDVTPSAGARSLEVVAPDGRVVPSVVDEAVTDADGTITAARVRFVADEVPGIGHSTGWAIRAGGDDVSGWRDEPAGTVIETDRYLIEVDPAAGGAVRRLFDKRALREVLRAGAFGNELVLEQEYSAHPQFNEGPWHLVPTGTVLARSTDHAADSVRVQSSAVGHRLVVTGRLGDSAYTQTIALLHGADRVDCRTTLDGFNGADQLVRICWAADVPGALPASDVGAAVVGRGFGFRGADVANHPWTLDNPAVNWFALTSTARVRISLPGGTPTQRAIGIAELVAADADAAGGLRPLAVALAGQGVTATTSIGGGARYGRLAVDSNLPDVRIAVGGPEDNAFTAQVLDLADEQYRIELDKQLAGTGTARVWIPAERPLREVWQPSADLSGVRDLPVLVVVGPAELDALVEDLADAAIEVAQSADAAVAGEPELDDYTVALLNTGLPSFNVDVDGTLTTAVLRSCTGWPSGVWLNPPRRTVPDGSNFQQQHWTHHFEYALVAGSGDWRANELVRAGHEFNHPLRSSQAAPAAGPPRPGHYLDLGDTEVVVTAVKASGNPVADGRTPPPVDALTVRLVEAAGRHQQYTIDTAFGVDAVTQLDLVERERGPITGPVPLAPMQIATLRLECAAGAGDTVLIDERDPHQPTYARYWLDNTGPAPIGGMVTAVHAEPTVVERAPGAGGPIDLAVTVASDRTDASTDTEVQLIVPTGWTAEPSTVAVSVPPGGFADLSVQVHPAEDAAPGIYWVRSRIPTGGQVIEDVTRVIIGASEAPELEVALAGPDVVDIGADARLVATVTNHARSPVSARVQLISPWHTWDVVDTWDTGVTVEPGGTARVTFACHAGPGTAPGTWWALAKVAGAGVVHFTEPVVLTVRP